MMITLYTWGADRVFAGTVSADPLGPMPSNSTPSAPPATTGTEVAQWTGAGWVVLPEAPEPDVGAAKASALATLADRRWRETQTFDYDGETDVPADPALSVITSIAVVEQIAPSGGAARTFKLKSGVFRSWTVAQIITYGMAIGAHVQACFDNEASLAAAITEATTIEGVAAIDIGTGWPT